MAIKRFTALFLAVVIMATALPFQASAAVSDYYSAVDSIENNATYIMAAQIYGSSAANEDKTTRLSVLDVPEVGANSTISKNQQYVGRNFSKAGNCISTAAGSMSTFEITAVDSGSADSSNNIGYYLKRGNDFLMLYQACDDVYKAYDSVYTYGSFTCSHYTFLTSPILKFGTAHQIWFWDSNLKAFYTNYASSTSSVGTYKSAQDAGNAAYEGYYINNSQYNSVKVRWDVTVTEDPVCSYSKYYLMGRYNSNTHTYFGDAISMIPDTYEYYDVITHTYQSNQYGYSGTALSPQFNYPTPQGGEAEGNYAKQISSLTLYKKSTAPTMTATVNVCANGVKTSARDGTMLALYSSALSAFVTATVANGTASFANLKIGTYSIMLTEGTVNTSRDLGQSIDVAFRDSNIKDIPVYKVTQNNTDVPAGKLPEITTTGWYFPNEYVTPKTSNIIYGDNNKTVSIFSKWYYPEDLTVNSGNILMPWKDVTISADYNYYEVGVSQLTDSGYVPVSVLESASVVTGYTSSPDNYFKLTIIRGSVNESPTGSISVSKPYPNYFRLECAANAQASSFVPGDVLKFKAIDGLTQSKSDYWCFYVPITDEITLTKYVPVSVDVFPAGTQFDIEYLPGTNGTGTARTEKKSAAVAKTLAGAIFTRSGYVQTGWTDIDGGAQLYALGANYKRDANITLYPVWTRKPSHSLTVIYGSMSGEHYEDDTVSVSANPRNGYRFAYWQGADSLTFTSGSASAAEISFVMPARDVTLTAIYSPIEYNAVFKADGNTVGTVPYTVETESITPPAVPAKTGYAGKWESYTLAVGGVTVNAVYTKNSYTIKWVVDSAETTEQVVFGASIAKPENPQKDGYTFVGWTPDVPSSMPASNLTFTAIFEKDPEVATVTINNNTGSKTINYGEQLRLTATKTNPPAGGATIVWYIGGEEKGRGETFIADAATADYTVTVKLLDNDGNIIKNDDSNEICDTEEVKVNAGFFQRLISFFKNLFRIERIVPQAFEES